MVTNATSSTDVSNYSPKPTAITCFGFVVAMLLLIYLGAWAATAILLSNQADAWIESQRRNGLHFQYGEPIFSGFPATVVITYPDLNVTSATSPIGWSWATPALSVSAQTLFLNKLSFNLTGAHTIAIPTASAPNLNLTTGNANIDLAFDSNGVISFASLSMSKLIATWSTQDVPLLNLSEGRFSLHSKMSTGSQKNSSMFALKLRNLRFSEVFSAPFEPTIEKIELVLETHIPSTTRPLAESLQAWRDNGDVIELREIDIVWPPISVTGTGTVTLDDKLQPVGTFNAKIQGFFETLDTLAAEGLVRSRDVSMAKIVLGLLTRAPPNGGPPELSISISIQDKNLYAGPVMLMELPTVAWPNRNTRP